MWAQQHRNSFRDTVQSRPATARRRRSCIWQSCLNDGVNVVEKIIFIWKIFNISSARQRGAIANNERRLD